MLFCIKIWMKDFSSQKLKNIKHELYFKCFWYYNIIHFTFCGKKVEYKLLNDRNRGTIERRKNILMIFWVYGEWQCRKKINLSLTFYLFPFYRLKNLFLSSLTHLNQILALGTSYVYRSEIWLLSRKLIWHLCPIEGLGTLQRSPVGLG